MTTIAYDGRYLAIDSQLTAGGRKMVGTKLFKIVSPSGERLVVAGAGTWKHIKHFIEWLQDDSLEDPIWDEFDALVAHPDGSVYLYQDSDQPEDVTGVPHTLGSGADYAQGAMLAGKTAPEAVRLATEADLYSGGAVKTHDTSVEKTKKRVTRKKTLDK